MTRLVDLVDLWTTNRKATVLPLVEELCALVNRPLADSEIIPILQHMFNALHSSIDPHWCSYNDIDKFFTVGEEDPNLISIIYAAALRVLRLQMVQIAHLFRFGIKIYVMSSNS